jgi:hypothetical protein
MKFVPTAEQQIPAGSSKTYEVKITVAGGTTYSDDYIMSSIAADASGVASTTSNNVSLTNANFVWSDMSAQGHDTTTTTDWTNGYLVKNLPTDTQVLTGTGTRP